jgi:hypothetical protein
VHTTLSSQTAGHRSLAALHRIHAFAKRHCRPISGVVTFIKLESKHVLHHTKNGV